jgi:hypothetical protein
MFGKREQLITLTADVGGLTLAFLAYYVVRIQSGWVQFSIEPEVILPLVAINAFLDGALRALRTLPALV